MPEKIITKEALSYFKGKYDDQMDGILAGKQDVLVSGENIKTINNESILGSGNITINGGGSSAPYALQDYQLDLSEEEFECSDADAEYIFENNPTAILLDGLVAVIRDITDDDSKGDYLRTYAFFEFPDDNQVIYYELGFSWDGSEYSFDLKPTDPIGGSGSGLTKLVVDATEFDQSTGLPTDAQLNDILDSKYDVVEIINAPGISNEMFYLDTYNTYNNQIIARYVCRTFTDNDENSLVAFEITRQNGSNSPTLNIPMPDFGIVKANESIPSGTGSTALQTLKVGGNYYTVGGNDDKLVPIEASLVPRTSVETIEMTSTWGSEEDFYQIAVSSYPSAIPDKVVVNYNNGESVEIPKTGAAPGGQAYIYGNMNEFGQPDFTTYPFCVGISIDQGFTSIVAPNDDATDVSIDAYIAADGQYDVQMPSGVTKTAILTDIANGKVPVLHVSIPDGNDSFWCYSSEAVNGEVKFIGESDGSRITIESDSSAWNLTFENIPDFSTFITNSVNNLLYYYTKNEVDGLIGAINQFHYEIYGSTSNVVDPQGNVLYLIGPTGSGSDQYEEYIYANSTWTKIGDTSIDLSGYATTSTVDTKSDIIVIQASAFECSPTFNTASVTISSSEIKKIYDFVDANGKAPQILILKYTEHGYGDVDLGFTLRTSVLESELHEIYYANQIYKSNVYGVIHLNFRFYNNSYGCDISCLRIPTKLSQLDDDSTHRIVTDTEKTTWSGKQDALVSGTNIKTINNESILGSGNITISGGGGTEKVYPIAITANPGVGDTLLAAAQNLTMADMPEAPGYTYAPFTLENDINYTEPYDAVLVEFHAGQQYLLPLVQSDSGTALYGEVDGNSMPIFDHYPAAVVFLLNSGSLSSVMLVSDVADGTLIATSLHGYVYSETTFSLNANGITTSDIDTAVTADKVPVAVVDWNYKDYKSWCPAEVRYDESNRTYYKFNGEYKGKEFTISNDGSSWSLAWITSAVKDMELIVDIDNANNKVYFRSLNDMRMMQSALPIVTLKLYDYTSHDFAGYLELTLSTQNSTETSIYYSSAQVADNGKGTITTLRVDSTDTLASGSYIFTADVSTVYTANITLAQDYSKMYFTDADLTYLKNHVPFAIKAIWDDGEGHSGSFVMNLSTTQEGGQADMPRIYSMMMVEGGTLSIMSLKIDGGYTSSTGCPIETYSPQ